MEFTIQLPRGAERVTMLGSADRNLKMIREGLGVNIAARNDTVCVSGRSESVTAARRVFDRLGDVARGNEHLSRKQVLDLISDSIDETASTEILEEIAFSEEPVSSDGDWSQMNVYSGGRRLTARNENQKAYLEAIRTHDLVFATGPAGTGKTYLAVAAAVHMLRSGRIRRLVLARPAVEAGEKLGFLPGDLEQKVNPYLRPLLDALQDMMDYATLRRFIESDVIEISPLAFMRGRTLNDAIILLDEAQNTTRGQMQMFLTRMGQRSKAIVTGDTTQIDLPDPRESGLIDATRRLERVDGVGFITFAKEDIVRHDLVQRIVEVYGHREDSERGA